MLKDVKRTRLKGHRLGTMANMATEICSRQSLQLPTLQLQEMRKEATHQQWERDKRARWWESMLHKGVSVSGEGTTSDRP